MLFTAFGMAMTACMALLQSVEGARLGPRRGIIPHAAVKSDGFRVASERVTALGRVDGRAAALQHDTPGAEVKHALQQDDDSKDALFQDNISANVEDGSDADLDQLFDSWKAPAQIRETMDSQPKTWRQSLGTMVEKQRLKKAAMPTPAPTPAPQDAAFDFDGLFKQFGLNDSAIKEITKPVPKTTVPQIDDGAEADMDKQIDDWNGSLLSMGQALAGLDKEPKVKKAETPTPAPTHTPQDQDQAAFDSEGFLKQSSLNDSLDLLHGEPNAPSRFEMTGSRQDQDAFISKVLLKLTSLNNTLNLLRKKTNTPTRKEIAKSVPKTTVPQVDDGVDADLDKLFDDWNRSSRSIPVRHPLAGSKKEFQNAGKPTPAPTPSPQDQSVLDFEEALSHVKVERIGRRRAPASELDALGGRIDELHAGNVSGGA